MRAERSWYYGVLVGAFVTLAFYAGELKRGSDEEVRYAWVEATHVFVALTALLGLGLASWRPRTQLAGKVCAGAGIGALTTHFLLVITVPMRGGEDVWALVWPALDVLGWAALPGALLVAANASARPRLARGAILFAATLGALLAARLMWSAFAYPSGLRVGLGVSWTAFMLVCGWSVTHDLLRLFAPRRDGATAGAPTRRAIPR